MEPVAKNNTPSPKARRGQNTTLMGMAISFVLAVVKAVGGILGNSYALIADAIESTVDVITSGLLWMGLRWSAKPADDNHPYGHGKAEALVAIGISLALFGQRCLLPSRAYIIFRYRMLRQKHLRSLYS